MKMRPEHFEDLKRMILANIPAGKLLETMKAYQAGGYSQTRFLFDLLYSIPRPVRQIWFDENEIYSYLDDTHIETALRRAVKEII